VGVEAGLQNIKQGVSLLRGNLFGFGHLYGCVAPGSMVNDR
jgi:hypothetical protein